MRFIALLALAVPGAAWATGDSAEFFEKSVRPVLAEHCYSCHGPEKQKSGLRLDHGSFLKSGGETGPAVVAGDPAASRLIVAVGYDDVDLQMPPDGKLPEEALTALRQWIADGAVWPEEPVPTDSAAPAKEVFDVAARRAEHWAWQPVQDSAPPTVANTAWPRTDIDRFILARLEQAGLSPAPEADKRVLIRRLYFDLTGLPPAPDVVEAFVADTDPYAYEKLVDSLLASPHFGERWGRHWLDLTRYAETYGHEQDYPVEYAWRYRDYVIRALNADVPYDQMLREHVAGDLLPQPRIDPASGFNESVTATGFWYMHQATHAPVDVRIDQADRIDNQIDVFSKAFLGMTVACARCHDHKFDAISANDYYALAGFLRSSRAQHAYLDPGGRVAEGMERLNRATERVKWAIDKGLEEASEQAAPLSPWLMATAEAERSGLEADQVARKLGLDEDTMLRWADALGEESVVNDAQHPLHLWSKALNEDGDIRATCERVAGWLADQPPPGTAQPGDVIFAHFDTPGDLDGWTAYGEAFASGPTGEGAWAEERGRVALVPAGVIHSGQVDSKVEGTLRSPDFRLEHEGIQYLGAGRNCELRLIIEGYELREFNGLLFDSTFLPVKHGDEFLWLYQVGGLGKFKGRNAYIEIVDPGEGWVAVDEIRFSDTPPQIAPDYAVLRALLAPGLPTSLEDLAARYDTLVQQAVAGGTGGGKPGAARALFNLVQREQLALPLSDSSRLARALDHKEKVADELPRHERVLAMTDGTPQDEFVQLRGSYKTPGDLVQRRFLEAVLGPEQPAVQQGSGRLELVERVLSEDNPLPARVMANRIWHYLMGRGIVPSTDNFGVLGQAPSHPELLDFLATRFREKGWSIKQAIRDIVTTQTYRMSSVPADAVAEEQDPDNVLLHRMNRRRLEAESVRDAILAVAGTLDATQFGPSVPAYISPFLEGNRRPEQSGPEDGARRRSIYMEVRRNYLPPMLQAFDMPVPDSTQGRRNVSNVPAQALILMNDPVVTAQAAAWAKQVMAEQESAEDRINALYLRALSRQPLPDESERMRAFMQAQATVYGIGPETAQHDERIWTDLCHVMFTLKEFIFLG